MKALMTATVPSMIGQFNMNNIKLLIDMGYEVHVACNFMDHSVWSEEKIQNLISELEGMNISTYQVDFERSISKFKCHIKAYKRMKQLMNENNYSLVHTHTPISSLITRLAFKSSKIYNTCKMIYTAHGFHFFKGNSAIKNMIFRSIESFASRYTDVLITINSEDYEAAQKFKLRTGGKVEYIPGVGIDLEKINSIEGDRVELCSKLEIPTNSILLLSVGELNENKNHSVIVNALKELPEDIHYLICGTGALKQELEKLAMSLDVDGRLHMLGYRRDVIKVCKSCDIFVFPSKREGLGLAAIEAMACGLPLITSNRHGIMDYSENNVNSFTCDPNNYKEFVDAVRKMSNDTMRRFGLKNLEKVKKYDIKLINKNMKRIYKENM